MHRLLALCTAVTLTLSCFTVFAQHTFSIVAIDPVTGDVGSAGATCLDSALTNGFDAYGISGIIPGVGAINAQALLQPANLNNGMNQMANGLNAQEIIDWLVANDINGTPEDRQYGVVTTDGINTSAAGFTGEDAFDFKGHLVGPNYAIQGNILIGPEVLEQMEANFLNCTGSLADRLMFAMQGAKIRGADARCFAEGVSSQSAFVRMARPGDNANDLTLDLRVASRPFGMDPIDSLQTRFNAWKAVNDPNTHDIGVTAIINPQTGGNLTTIESLTVEITNFGTMAIDTFDVAYVFNGGPVVTETAFLSLAPGATGQFIFPGPIDFSAFGEYPVSVFTRAGDELNCNDTTSTVIAHLARNDVAITGLSGLENPACGPAFPVFFEMTNEGLDTLTSAMVEVQVNGNTVDGYLWKGALPLGESVFLGVSLTDAIDGVNGLWIEASSPNGVTDQVPEDNGLFESFDYSSDNDFVLVEVLTDFYPGETSWEIADESGEVVAAGGGYFSQFSLFLANVCLPKNSCYTFTIYDAYGDGICCAYGKGFFRVTDALGTTLVQGGEFGFVDSASFCFKTSSVSTFDESTDVWLAPNPFDEEIRVTIEDPTPLGRIRLELFNSTGVLVNSAEVSMNAPSVLATISTHDVPPGGYFVRITSGAKTTVRQLVKVE